MYFSCQLCSSPATNGAGWAYTESDRGKQRESLFHGTDVPAATIKMTKAPKLIGIISDTHGLLRPQALAALQGSDLIIHAGDVGDPKILDALRIVAPVFAVRGNVDTEPWALSLPETEVIETGLATFYVLHDLHALDLDPAAAGFQVVVTGHSHKPANSERDGVLFLNPGSAGPRRFDLPVTVARLELDCRPWKVTFIDLLGTKPSEN